MATKTTKTTTPATTETKTTPKVAKKTTETKTTTAKLGKPHVKVLSALAKKNGLTRAEISATTEITSGFTSLLGHLDPAKREEGSLSAKGYIKPEIQDEEGKNVVRWSITASGKKALEAALKAAK